MAILYRMGTGNGSGGDLKPFIVNFTCHSGFIGKTVTMEYLGTPHAGETVDNVSGTVANDGTLTLYPMHDGLWKYYAISDLSGYHEETITLEKWGNYPVELLDTPDGATATPTDDVQTWLHCANIWDKSYTTIAEVIADTTSLNALIADENANNYLVRSTSFATDMCANETAMTYIGLNDYCANKLLADSTWCTAICNSPHFEKVLNKSVPTLTSNTGSDGGKVFRSSIYNSSYEGYWAFNDSGIWVSAESNVVGEYVGYNFNSKVILKKVYIKAVNSNFNGTCAIEASNDGSTYTTLKNNVSYNSNGINVNISNDTSYSHYRIKIISCQQTHVEIRRLQFYGREEA